ncbi:DNA-binding response regulator [Actinoplanes sp. NBRC 14428]|uniref:DNA-binding NarL/FixJ family response regulator n=1 Tax=Pseudosporangium ferrugineum TaxID=439699 RepID=A0A2T0SEV6_9ACTN|nr:response regulator transcription factor [Pseudosporangium ferrugineum]PRY31931.1 DNA-binding NarL/FixJ family response regulator [Pseudosporangium ferrugineum]BCJ49831.1 DNA-binding response regulator [Actinoplanes sp. NBRC 14428]
MTTRTDEGRGPAMPLTPDTSILVSIVEDHPLYRMALARVVDGLPGCTLGAVAGSVEEFLAYRTRPGGVVLLDLHLPGRQGPAAALAVTEAGHRPLVVSAQAGQADVLAVLAAGARGYLTKSAEEREIAAAVRQVADGGTYVSPTLAGFLLDSARPRQAGPRLALTPREREVLGLLAEGERDVDIARALGISVRTVRSHLDRIREKTGQRRRSELTRLAIGEGISSRLRVTV